MGVNRVIPAVALAAIGTLEQWAPGWRLVYRLA